MTVKRSLISRPLLYDDALITSLYRYGEYDCVVRLFTRGAGRIRAFYKKGYLSSLALGQARVGFVAGSEQKMARLYSVDSDPRCLLFASSLKLFAYSTYVAELVEKLIPEHEVIEPVFELMNQSHEALLLHDAQSYVLRALELKLLDALGYLPEFPRPAENLFYDPLSSRFVTSLSPQGFSVNKLALDAALAMLRLPVGSLAFNEKAELLMIGRIFHSRLKLLGLLPLRSLAFF